MCHFLLICTIFFGCNENKEKEISKEYLDALNSWKSERYVEVTESWIPLAGLSWLDPGESTFGSDTSNRIVFPNAVPPYIGNFILVDETVVMTTFPEIKIINNDSIMSDHQIVVDESKVFKIETIEWTIIKRAGQYAARIWDRSPVEIDSFKLEYFEPDPNWVIKSQFEVYPEGRTYPIANVVGSVTNTPIPGKLSFKFEGERYSLDVMEGDEDTWFVIFSDATNGKKTYGAGRYMYVNKNKNGEKVVIDFNRAYNPPCAFTEYATCPLPPVQNRLPFLVQAGEKIRISDY